LSLGESEIVRNAIANSDSGFVAKASGVGKKIAERVVVDLSDKVGLAVTIAQVSGVSHIPAGDEALEALMALGYTLNDATVALETIAKDIPTSERVRLALQGA
jgi:Holliday junction DNA helicase RuvA